MRTNGRCKPAELARASTEVLGTGHDHSDAPLYFIWGACVSIEPNCYLS